MNIRLNEKLNPQIYPTNLQLNKISKQTKEHNLMPAKFQQTITTNVEGRMVNYFEMDTINFRINITTYALDINDEMVPETVKTSGWIEMFADEAKTIPNVDPSDFAKFAQAMPLVKTLIYSFAKIAGIVPDEATIE